MMMVAATAGRRASGRIRIMLPRYQAARCIRHALATDAEIIVRSSDRARGREQNKNLENTTPTRCAWSWHAQELAP